MRVSFAQLWEQIDSEKFGSSPLMGSGEEARAISAVRAGKTLHEEGEASFWDEFISLCSNADGLAELLGVSREKVTSWPSRIKDYLQKLDKYNVENPSEKKKVEMIPTGENGAFTTNSDPTSIGDVT